MFDDAFFSGFEKMAADEAAQTSTLKRYILPALAAAAGVGIGSYALSRRGGKKLISPFIGNEKMRAGPDTRSAFKRFTDNIRWGTDDFRVLNKEQHSVKLKKDEVAFLRQPPVREYVQGDKSQIFGSTEAAEILRNNKLTESTFIRSVSKNLHPKTNGISFKTSFLEGGADSERGLKELKDLHEKWTKGGKGFYIKELFTTGGSGVGGGAFINEKDIENFIKRKTKPTDPMYGRIKNMFAGENRFMIQEKMNVVKDKITNNPIEFRVHTVGDKVIDTTMRSGITPNPLDARRAQAAMQDFVNKMPKKMKDRKFTMAADVIKTEDGFKIVETNPGGQSGYLDPDFMKEKGFLPHMKSVFLNNRLYEELTGRKSQLMAGIGGATKGTLAGVGTAGGIKAYDERDAVFSKIKSMSERIRDRLGQR